MKIEETNITSIKDYRKTKPKASNKEVKYTTPAKITEFKILRPLSQQTSANMTKDEVQAILDPGYDPKKANNNSSNSSGSNLGSIVDFETLSALFPNVKKTNETELVEFCLMEGYSLSYEQAKSAIEQYKQDAKDAKLVFKQVEDIKKEFEERIKDVDLSGLDKITSIYEKKDKREMLANFETPDNFIPSKKSSRVTKNIAKLYVRELQEKLKDYEIEVVDTRSSDVTNDMVQVQITKDNYFMQLFFNDFLSTVKKGKMHPNVQIYIQTPESENFDWQYDGIDRILNKINKTFHGTVGSVSIDSYNEKGEAEFYIDVSMEAGPSYYAIVETMKAPQDKKTKEKLDDTTGLSEEEIKRTKDMISKSPDANKYYKQYGLIFVNSCIKNDTFNLNLAMAKSLLLETGQYFSSNGEIPFDYVNELTNYIAEEENDYYIDESIFDIANSFAIKELNANEEHHNTVFKMLDYAKKHPSEKVFDFAENLADNIFSFEEVDEILKMLDSSSTKKQNVIIQKVNKLVRDFDLSGDLKPEIRIFEQLKHELHIK